MKDISVKALAKINLGLDVVRKREDGYHEVRMVMQTIHLFDRLEISKNTSGEITMETNLSFLPTNENNLVYKAAKLLQDEFAIKDGVHVWLHKYIPVAAGMAGGSTDAAAVLYGMNQIFDLGLTREELMERGVKIGADVPYCIMRGTALAEGIGEKLSKLPPMVKCPVLIAKPQISVSTKFVYENLKLGSDMVHPDIDRLVADIREKDLYKIAADMGNVLETVTIPAYPVIADIKDHMMEHGAVNAMMSGSGPTVFGLFDKEATAVEAYEAMKASGLAKQVYLTSIYNNARKYKGMVSKMTEDLTLNMDAYLPLRDVVFNTLREAILKGELKPGERLMELQLAAKLGVSRTPIREAIRMLEQEGLAVTIPRKGAEVAKMTEKDMEDVLQIREALDELAAKIACEQISEEQLEELVATMHEFEESTKTDNVKKIAEADVKFHDIIYQSTGNPKLVNMLNNLREQMYRYRVEYLKDENNYPTLMKEHKDIVEGLVRKNKMQVTATMHQHVKNQAVAVKAMIQEQE